MIEDIVEGAVSAWPVVGWKSFLLLIAVIALLIYLASLSDKACAQKHCDAGGKPQVLNDQCVCVTKPAD